MAHLDNKVDQKQDIFELNQELKVSDTDHTLLMDLLQNPRPANDAMKKLMTLLDEA